MIKHRLIANLLVHQGNVVQTRQFERTSMVGSAFTAVDFFNTWAVDEIGVLEISHDRAYVERFIAIIEELSRRCFVPLSVGGKVRDMDLVHRYVRAGADKVIVNTGGIEQPRLLGEIASSYGSQCLVVSIDGWPDDSLPSGFRVMVDNGRRSTDLDVVTWARRAVELGAGEILLNSLTHDGDKRGYNLPLIRTVSDAVTVPVIAMGGVGKWADLVDGIGAGADAVAAGNIFHYTEHSTKKAKNFLIQSGLNVRPTTFYKLQTPRRVRYKPF